MSTLANEIRQAVREEVASLVNAATMKEQRLLTIKQAARYIKASERIIFDLLKKGRLHRVKIGKFTTVDVSELDALIEESKR